LFKKKKNIMKKSIKKNIKNFLYSIGFYPFIRKFYTLLYKEQSSSRKANFTKKLFICLETFFRSQIIIISGRKNLIEKKAILFRKTCEKMRIFISPNNKFIYDIDFFILPIYSLPKKDKNFSIIGNLTINYSKIIEKGVISIEEEIKNKINKKEVTQSQKVFLYSLLEVCNGIKILRNRYLKKLANSKWKNNQNITEIQKILERVPLYPASNFKEALQCFLFVNSLLWTNDYPLIGLGRLDQILYPYLKYDLENGNITEKEALNLLKEFFIKIHEGYKYKSNTLIGDTGQVIILGGKNIDDSDASNKLTFMIIDVLQELKFPDIKIILRIYSKTSNELWNKALECLLSGIQYPLFSNDEVIIPALMKFGYLKEDAFNYGTSACWEPFIPGKSLDQNNLLNLNLLKPFNETVAQIVQQKEIIKNFNDFLNLYNKNLKVYIKKEIKELNKINFEPSPFLSLLIDDCLENLKDISEGGAKYNNYGILSVGLGNTVNALFNIERIVFEEKRYSFDELFRVIENNFYNSEILLENLRNKGLKFCMDDEKVIYLVNNIIEIIFQTLKNLKNKFGERFKFGLSSPSFVSMGEDCPASLDGRKYGNPLGTNISPISFSPSLSYTEIANFASQINYEEAFNGAVLDLILERNFVDQNREKFINFLITFFNFGGMQCHLNILNYNILMKAKENPDLFPDLIVRVWGFCAYFKDLPEEYQNLVVERAKYYESLSNQYPEV